METIADRLMKGEARALARGISLVENRNPGAQELVKAVFHRVGTVPVIGITGAPGSGKSTLVNSLIERIPLSYPRLGILAVDPSSPFSGGAVLGDRIRMMRHSTDPRVYIRSMATRGHLGGLARAAGEAVALMEAAGRDFILVETVGVGQDEVDVVGLAEQVLLVLTPGSGDDVQLFKAGVMEIADVFVLNKADTPESHELERRLAALVETGGVDTPRPPTVKTVAVTGEGMDKLWEVVEDRIRSRTAEEREKRRKRRIAWMFRHILHDKMAEKISAVLPDPAFEKLVDRIYRHEIDPYTQAERILSEIGET